MIRMLFVAVLFLFGAIDVSQAQQQNWAKCGEDQGYCIFPSVTDRLVRYGHEDQWIYLQVAAKVIPCDVTYFGDPAIKQGKTCQYIDIPPQGSNFVTFCQESKNDCPAPGTGVQVFLVMFKGKTTQQYVVRAMTNAPFKCDVDTLAHGRDIAEKDAKECLIRPLFDPAFTKMTTCATEPFNCEVALNANAKLMRFGKEGNYQNGLDIGYTYLIGNIKDLKCSRDTFGPVDPYNGETKSCWYADLPTSVFP